MEISHTDDDPVLVSALKCQLSLIQTKLRFVRDDLEKARAEAKSCRADYDRVRQENMIIKDKFEEAIDKIYVFLGVERVI